MFRNRSNSILNRRREKKATAFLYSVFRMVLLISIGYLVLYPVIVMISGSLKTPAAYIDRSIIYIPKSVTTEYYGVAIKAIDYFNSLKSTLINQMVSAVLEIAVCSFIAYGMARFDFKGKSIFNFLLILIILVPTQMLIISMMMNYSKFDIFGIFGLLNKLTGIDLRINLLNTVWTFYLPSILGVGLRAGIIIYIYIQFFKGLPKELEEAAWIDGAGLFRTFFSIAIPSSSVVFTTVSIFAMVWHWNEYFEPIMFMSKNFPLSVKIYELENLIEAIGVYDTYPQYSTKKAACFIFILPVLAVYLILQKKFVKSIDRVGITG